MQLIRPSGTLRHRFGANRAAVPDQWAILARALGEFQLSPNRLWTAQRLTAMDPALDAESERWERMSLFVILLQVVLEEGSTSLPVARIEDRLERLLKVAANAAEAMSEEAGLVLAPPFGGPEAAPTLAEAIRRDLDSGELGWLVGGPEAKRPIVCDRDHVYTGQTFAGEVSVVASLAARLEGTVVPEEAAGVAIAEVLAKMPFDLKPGEADEKLANAKTLLGVPLGLVTGGPGSGKTTFVTILLRALVRIGIDPARISLAAPTGKAANRMQESIGAQLAEVAERHGALPAADQELRDRLPTPRTLHRLLRYSPYFGTFRHDADDPVASDVVIIDEASMIDLELMQALVEALRPETRLILVGDADQLPSVQAGAVFRDLMAEGEVDGLGVVRLEGSHRTHGTAGGAQIDEAAQGINRGSLDIETIGRAISFEEVPGSDLALMERGAGVALVERSEELTPWDFVREWFRDRADLRLIYDAEYEDEPHPHRQRALFEHAEDGSFEASSRATIEEIFAFFESSRILCATRRGPCGSDTVNRKMRSLFTRAYSFRDSVRFRPGEPVMVTKNTYEHELFNGDQGVVLYTRRNDEETAHKRVVFRDGDGFRAVVLDKIRDRLDHCYAMTVHKSQGSEYDAVAVMLPESPHPMLTREILYTGLTRAKSLALIYGGPSDVETAVHNRMERFSTVRARLVTRG